MKKLSRYCMIGCLMMLLMACSNQEEKKTQALQENAVEPTPETPTTDTTKKTDKALVVYFTLPEDVSTEGVDAIGSASIVVNDGNVLGNLEYMAQVIQEEISADTFEIETVQAYPRDHDPLVDQAAQEQDDEARPELSSTLENLSDYDVIFLGYPNWWADLPMPVYTFLETYDLSGKTIIPFTAHGGSGFSNTVDEIASLQPNATVSETGMSISRNDVASSKATIQAWLDKLGY